MAILLCVVLLSGCSGASAASPSPGFDQLSAESTPAPISTPIPTPAPTPTPEPTPIPAPIDTQTAFNGTWEGMLSEPVLGYRQFTLDCFESSGRISTTLISLVGDTFNYQYNSTNNSLNGNTLKVWWNDDAHRAEIDFTLSNDSQMEGTFSQYGQSATISFTKTPDTPTSGTYHIEKQTNLMELLKANSDFSNTDATDVEFTYDYSDSRLTELKNKYDLETVAGDGDTQSKAIKLMDWLSAGISHTGNGNTVELNALSMLGYAYNQNKGLTCKYLSITLSEMYLSVGIQARALWLFPQKYEGDNHVVVMVWIPENEKWIMLDPSFDCYFSDADGNILSPIEIRDKIAAEEDMTLNSNAKDDYIDYYNYLAKDMFYFKCAQNTAFGAFENADQPPQMVYLCPNGLDLKDWTIQENAYWNSVADDPLTADQLAEQEDSIRNAVYTYATADSFWAKSKQ